MIDLAPKGAIFISQLIAKQRERIRRRGLLEWELPRDREIVEDYYDENEHGNYTLNPHVHEIRDVNFSLHLKREVSS